jgi:hypothetical protein
MLHERQDKTETTDKRSDGVYSYKTGGWRRPERLPPSEAEKTFNAEEMDSILSDAV